MNAGCRRPRRLLRSSAPLARTPCAPGGRATTVCVAGFAFILRIRAVWPIVGWAASLLLDGVGSVGASSAGSGMAYPAYLSGLVAGPIVGVPYRLMCREKPPQGTAHIPIPLLATAKPVLEALSAHKKARPRI